MIDRPTWLAMRRLAASGIIVLAEGQSRVLRQSPDIAAAANSSFDPQARATELRGEAERSLRMARVLAAGGFQDEALPLISKAISIAAAARLATLGELAAGTTMATPARVRELVDRGVLAPQAETALAALWPAGGARSVADLASLVDMAALIIARLDDGEWAKAA